MIYKVFADNDSFNEVEFSRGINIVLGVKDISSDDKDTMNGVGKTTLLEIIDFCLGSKADKNSYLKKIDYIKDWTFNLDMDLYGTRYIISRSIENSNKIYIDGDITKFNTSPEKDENGYYFKINDWRDILGSYYFNLKKSSSKYNPTFRSLISYFIRKSSESFIDPLEHHRKQKTWDIQVNNAFLLGLDSKCASDFQILKDNINENNKELKKFDKSTIGEMETKKINMENELNRKNETLSSFRIHENYSEIENQVNQLSTELNYLANDTMILKRKLNIYNKSISNETPPKNELLGKLYDEIEEMFNIKTKKSLENIRSFHNNLIKNRKSFLKVEISEIKKEIDYNEKLIEDKGQQRSKFMKILETHNAFDEFKLLQEQIYEEKIKLNDIKIYIDNFNRISQNKKELKEEKNILKEKIVREYNVYRPLWEESIRLFGENTKFLYGSSGELIINLDQAYKFQINFPKNDSRGISKMKIFCYDLMLLERNSSENNIDFLIHDSEIFSDVDSRQVAKALQLAENKCDTKDLQYIFTLNSDELEKIKLELPIDFNVDKYVRLRLNDNNPNGHLLGVMF